MNNIKLIVCDLDGTLLNDKKEISNKTIETLEQVRKKGIKICFASGRYDQMMSMYSDAIQGVDYLLSCNGACVNDKNGKTIFKVTLANGCVKKVFNFLKENKMVCMTYTTDKIYYIDGCEKLKNRITDYEKLSKEKGFPKKLNAYPINLSDDLNLLDDVIKVVVYENDARKLELLKKFVNTDKDMISEVTGYGLLGIFNPGVSKFSGIETIKKELGIGTNEVAVFGDFDNDLSMFRSAKLRIAMGNASETIKKAASHIALTNNDDGVATFIVDNIL